MGVEEQADRRKAEVRRKKVEMGNANVVFIKNRAFYLRDIRLFFLVHEATFLQNPLEALVH